MKYYTFPLNKNVPNVRVSVPINGVSTYLYLSFNYNRGGEFWSMTVADSKNNTLVSDIPLVRGEDGAENLLRQLGHLGIGSAYVHKLVDMPSTDSPNYENWLEEFELWWGSEAQ